MIIFFKKYTCKCFLIQVIIHKCVIKSKIQWINSEEEFNSTNFELNAIFNYSMYTEWISKDAERFLYRWSFWFVEGGGGVLKSATDKKTPQKTNNLKKTHKHCNCKVKVLRILSRYRYSEAKLYSHVTWSRGKSLSSKISSHGLTERFWERTWHPPLPQSPFYDHHMNDTFIPRDLLYRALILSMMAQP